MNKIIGFILFCSLFYSCQYSTQNNKQADQVVYDLETLNKYIFKKDIDALLEPAIKKYILEGNRVDQKDWLYFMHSEKIHINH